MPTRSTRSRGVAAMAATGALLAGLALAASDRAAPPAGAQAGAAGDGFTLSIAQLRINQRISSAAVRRSNEALARLDATPPAGATGPRGPSDAHASSSPYAIPGTALPDDDAVVVEQVALAAGSYLAGADANVHNAGAAEGTAYCLLTHSDPDRPVVVAGMFATVRPLRFQHVGLSGAFTLERPGTLDLRCRNSDPTGALSYRQGTLWAVRVAALATL